MALVRHAFGSAQWTHRLRLAGHAQRGEQHRFAALLFFQHGRGRYVVAQRRGEQFVQSFPRSSEPGQDGRLYHNRFRQYRRQCGLCGNVQSRGRYLLRSRRSGGSTDADTFTDTNSYRHNCTHADTFTDTFTDPNSYRHGYADNDTFSDTYSYADRNSNTDSNSDASGTGHQPLDANVKNIF